MPASSVSMLLISLSVGRIISTPPSSCSSAAMSISVRASASGFVTCRPPQNRAYQDFVVGQLVNDLDTAQADPNQRRRRDVAHRQHTSVDLNRLESTLACQCGQGTPGEV